MAKSSVALVVGLLIGGAVTYYSSLERDVQYRIQLLHHQLDFLGAQNLLLAEFAGSCETDDFELFMRVQTHELENFRIGFTQLKKNILVDSDRIERDISNHYQTLSNNLAVNQKTIEQCN
ncbi:hypothetical protein BST95_06655 [Halioglobus japonicus]|uniref:Uncharacterized protein n=1 Tax=Halioglobus japonicus TaxID=930805 RepID=A0AAP8MAW3_9GAMM|nr:hypothetical protein [Halioglobus japonicus]AQA17289.1 hypothetical protein BST95_02665 [Halioglobus japonicus]AQA17965.1 hypothetical protein BST95_06655 [Halioglobus japonicus]PLW84492.1 hypothetical protein C0029_18940 [Halioglobus japonicus]